MSSFKRDFQNDPVSLPIGTIKRAVFSDTSTVTDILYENGTWISSNAVYSQASYPELYSQLGLLNIRNFTLRNSGTTTRFLQNVIYGNGLYVYGGPLSPNVWTSTDGITWTERTTGEGQSNQGLTYGNGLYVFCAGSVNIRTSTNAITWTARTVIGANKLTYGNGLYVAAWNASGNTIRTSTDGITWTNRVPVSTAFTQYTALTYGNGLYIYSTADNNSILGTSTDGITWTARNSGTLSIIFALTYGNGLYVYGGGGGALATSTDGITWTARTSGITSSILALTYGNGLYVYGGAGGVLATSTDAITWDLRGSGTATNINGVTYGNGLYIYVGSSGVLATSTDPTVLLDPAYNVATDFYIPGFVNTGSYETIASNPPPVQKFFVKAK
jgi:hypothetical protein